jgi:anti-sigma-K factor RskA
MQYDILHKIKSLTYFRVTVAVSVKVKAWAALFFRVNFWRLFIIEVLAIALLALSWTLTLYPGGKLW